MHKVINTIIWDWNGTLFDDVDICIESINQLLNNRSLPQLQRPQYLEVFDFPVKEYYQKIGFDFTVEPFKIPADQFIELYFSKIEQSQLHTNALELLHYFQSKGYRQFILSASEQNKLNETLKKIEIYSFFEKVVGLGNDYAASKKELGIELLKNIGIDPLEVCLIGDTIHDYEVANAIGCNCILVAEGHQSAKRLKSTKCVVIENLMGLKEVF